MGRSSSVSTVQSLVFYAILFWVMHRCIHLSLCILSCAAIIAFVNQGTGFWEAHGASGRKQVSQCFVPVWGKLWMRHCFWICLFSQFRFGEASHPGPRQEVPDSWQIGIFNPTGLANKVDQVITLPGECWFGCETHLTQLGFKKFCTGLRALDCRFRFVHPGAFCPYRSTPEVGTYSGVVALSSQPIRPLPHNFDEQLFASARLQVYGGNFFGQWVQCGVVYGYPDSAQHLQRSYQTEVLLDAVITRIAEQAVGPRVICGDLNHGPGELHQLSRLYDLGFRELQDLALTRWGIPVRATGKGAQNIDQVWVSPELQASLLRVQLYDDLWAGHVAVSGVFANHHPSQLRYHWRFPQTFPWPKDWQCDYHGPWTDPTFSYAAMWNHFEFMASKNLGGVSVSQSSFGRGATLSHEPRLSHIAPPKKGREGDIQPKFFGLSLQHNRWFRQLRRLQALVRLLTKMPDHPHLAEHCKDVWRAIRFAPGFGLGFWVWWNQNVQHCPYPDGFPLEVPQVEQAQQMFDCFAKVVRQFEQRLIASRRQHAVARSAKNPHSVFHDCAKEQPAKVDSLIEQVQLPIEAVNHDDSSIILTHPVKLLPNQPVVGNGISYEVVVADHDQIWLDKLDKLEVGQTLLQERIVSSDKDILDAFGQVWSERWQKIHQIPASQWQTIMEFCTRTLPRIHWTFTPWTSGVFRGIVQKKKRRAAVGPDGVSRKDLMALPDSGVQSILQLYRHLEQGGAWPQQLLTGFVSALDKQRGTGGVDSYRPITVYPLVTRVWSSFRAKQALDSLTRVLPPSIRGGVPAKQSASIWFEIAQAIESAHVTSTSMCGLVLDIKRAFNAIPRAPLWHALLLLDFPPDLLETWVQFVSGQKRHFRVRDSVGAGHASVVGFPEGCAMSVFAMCVIDWLLVLWLQAANPGPRDLYVYVDDWHITFSSPDEFLTVWPAVNQFADALALDLDHDKSFLWAAQPQDRATLRQLSSLDLVLSARDLGAHQNFCRRCGNRVLVARIEALKGHWQKLRVSLGPRKLKLQSLYQMAWPRAFVGISVVSLGLGHFATLRTGAMYGLRSNRVGANPLLHLTSCGFGIDPEQWAIARTFREIRELGNHDDILALIALGVRDPTSVPANGPASILVQRCQRLGWQALPNGLFQDPLGTFDVLSLHWDALQSRLQWAWPRLMAAELHHRPSFNGLQFADIQELGTALQAFGPADQVFLRSCLDGTLYIDLGKEKHERGSDSRCALCGAADSFYHRIWVCEHFSSCRQDFPWLSLIPFLPQCLTCHGWPLQVASWVTMQRWFEHPCPIVHLPRWPPGLAPDVLDFFTDGACAVPHDPKFRFASWALSLVLPGDNPMANQIVGAGHVVGHQQTAYRGELCAVVEAFRLSLHAEGRVRIWCDNQAVVQKVGRLLKGGKVKVNSPHADLWGQVRAYIDSYNLADRVQIIKVVSHCDGNQALTPVEEWAFWHNALVDAAATQVNFQRPQAFWDDWLEMVQAVTFQRMVHRAVLEVLLRVGRFGKQGHEGEDFHAVHAPNEHGGREPDDGPQQLGAPPGQWFDPVKLHRQYGALNVGAIHTWWQRIGVSALHSDRHLRWISGLQLYIDFWLELGHPGPISTRPHQWLVDNTDAPAAISVVRRTTMFLRVWWAYMKAHTFRVPKQLARPCSGTLAYWSQCYRLPWCQARLDTIDRLLLQVKHRQLLAPADLAEVVFFPRPEVVI